MASLQATTTISSSVYQRKKNEEGKGMREEGRKTTEYMAHSV